MTTDVAFFTMGPGEREAELCKLWTAQVRRQILYLHVGQQSINSI